MTLLFSFFLTLKLLAQPYIPVSTYNGTLYWVGRAATVIDLSVAGTNYDDITSNSWYHPDNWSTTSGGASSVNLIPGTLTNVIFDGNSLADNCRIGSAPNTLSSNVNVCGYTAGACPLSVKLNPGYVGTVSFATGWELFIQAGGLLELNAGTLSGGDDRILLQNGADFTLNTGGTFWIPAASKFEIINGDFTINGGTFNHNNATVAISAGTISTNGVALHNLILSNGVTLNGDVTVGNHLSLNATTLNLNNFSITVGTTALATARTFSMGGATLHSHLPTPGTNAGAITISNGEINIMNGHLYLNNTHSFAGFSASATGRIRISGTANQTLENVPGLSGTLLPQGCLPTIIIDKPSGTLNLQGLISARGGWTHTQGTVNPGTSTVYFRNNGSFVLDVDNPTQMQFNNLEINRGTISLDDYLDVNGNLSVATGSTLTCGTSEGEDVYVGGNFTNAGTFNPPALGYLYFDGTATQTITFTGGGSFTETFLQNDVVLASNITVTKDIHIENTGQLDASSRTINLSGNWINNGVFLSSTGLVNFSGAPSAQTISGTSASDFNNLTINNSNGLSLDAPASVKGTLTFISGKIASTAPNTLTIKDGATLTGYGSASYVTGILRKEGNDYPFTFPVGSTGRYAPVTLSEAIDTQNNDEFTVEYFPATHAFSTSIDGTANLTQIGQNDYWNIDRPTGVAKPKVKLSWNTWSGVSWLAADMAVAHFRDAPDNLWEQAATSYTITGDANSGTVMTNQVVNTFSDFAFAEYANVLSVTLSNFYVDALGDGNVLVRWETSSEHNSNYFILSKSTDLKHFSVVDTVFAHGTTNIRQQYQVPDRVLCDCDVYYTLTEIDFDGNIQSHPIIAFNATYKKQGRLPLYPSILDRGENITIHTDDDSPYVDLQIISTQGLDVTGKCLHHAVEENIIIETTNLCSGMYIVKFKNDNITHFSRFLIK